MFLYLLFQPNFSYLKIIKYCILVKIYNIFWVIMMKPILEKKRKREKPSICTREAMSRRAPKNGSRYLQRHRMKNIYKVWDIVGSEWELESGSHDLRIEAIWMRVINTYGNIIWDRKSSWQLTKYYYLDFTMIQDEDLC